MIEYTDKEKGRFYGNDPHQNDERTEFEVDRSRIIQCSI